MENMQDCIKEIFEIESIEALECFLNSQTDTDEVRQYLFNEFLKYADYKNAEEWNKAVRLCESLAIIGWGEHEAVEALRTPYFNGNPTTFFLNRFKKPRFVDAIWSKRKDGITMEPLRTHFHASPEDPLQRPTIIVEYPTKEDIQDLKLQSQRNWIPKNPIQIVRTLNNCYAGFRPMIESIESELQPALDSRMRPELYGRAVNRIIINCSYSFDDGDHCRCNYIIADEKLKLRQKELYPTLRQMYSETEIKKNGYYLCNRFQFNPFRTDTGTVRILITFEKEISKRSYPEQKEIMSRYLSFVLNQITDKLRKKKINYDCDLMLADFHAILTEWQQKGLLPA